MDLIERDAVIWITAETGALETQRRVRELPAINRWISVEDALPENKCGVIFTVDRWHPFVCVGYRINSEREGLKLQRWFDKLSGLYFSDYDVKAWMPMPDAYKPPEKE